MVVSNNDSVLAVVRGSGIYLGSMAVHWIVVIAAYQFSGRVFGKKCPSKGVGQYGRVLIALYMHLEVQALSSSLAECPQAIMSGN